MQRFTMSTGRWLATLALAALATLGHSAAQAQTSIMIWPLDPSIEDDQRAAALWLENRGSATVSLQVRILAWSQANGRDDYAPQEAVLPSPPLIVVPPGQRQLVRLMKTHTVAENTEESYRILVDELPDNGPNESDSARSPGSSMGIKLQIRYSVPLFVSGKGHWLKPRPDKPRDTATAGRVALDWRTERDGADLYLVLRNSGNTHARLTEASWAQGEAKTVINPGLLGYVLAGSQMRFKLEAPPPPGAVPQARVNGSEKPLAFSPASASRAQ